MRRLLLPAIAIGLLIGGVASASGSGMVPSFLGCPGTKAAVKPHSIVLSCADGNLYLNKLSWSKWTATSAAGTGVAHANDCTPNCAAGKFHAYPGVTVKLSRPESCTRGRRLFTRISWRFTKKKPMGTARQSSMSAPFSHPSGCS